MKSNPTIERLYLSAFTILGAAFILSSFMWGKKTMKSKHTTDPTKYDDKHMRESIKGKSLFFAIVDGELSELDTLDKIKDKIRGWRLFQPQDDEPVISSVSMSAQEVIMTHIDSEECEGKNETNKEENSTDA